MGSSCSSLSAIRGPTTISSAKPAQLVERAKQSKVLSLERCAWPSQALTLSGLRSIALNRVTGISMDALARLLSTSQSSIKSVKVRNCKLEGSIEELGLEKLTKLTQIDLSGNSFRVSTLDGFPPSVEQLILSDNNLHHRVEGGSKLVNMTLLNLSQNRNITDVSGLAFPSFAALEELNLDSTGITSLPSNISQCPRLVVLSVQSNKLTSVPVEILRDSPLLHTIHLEGNDTLTQGVFLDLPGADAYMARRKARIDKQIAGGTYRPDLAII